jgi:hypothetical protein
MAGIGSGMVPAIEPGPGSHRSGPDDSMWPGGPIAVLGTAERSDGTARRTAGSAVAAAGRPADGLLDGVVLTTADLDAMPILNGAGAKSPDSAAPRDDAYLAAGARWGSVC